MYKAIIGILFLSVFSDATAQTDALTLDEEMAKRMAALPLHCIETEYPNKLNQVLTDSTYLDSPKNLHPFFMAVLTGIRRYTGIGFWQLC